MLTFELHDEIVTFYYNKSSFLTYSLSTYEVSPKGIANDSIWLSDILVDVYRYACNQGWHSGELSKTPQEMTINSLADAHLYDFVDFNVYEINNVFVYCHVGFEPCCDIHIDTNSLNLSLTELFDVVIPLKNIVDKLLWDPAHFVLPDVSVTQKVPLWLLMDHSFLMLNSTIPMEDLANRLIEWERTEDADYEEIVPFME